MDNKNDWIEICKMVSSKCNLIFPHIKSNKLKSEIVSNLFESQCANYFQSIGMNIKGADCDKDPDLFDLDNKKPYEIKVTKVKNNEIEKCKWMGGKYSKRTSDYFLIMWNTTGHDIVFNITKCFIDENEWNTIDNGKNNYYATVFKSENILNRNYKTIIGKIISNKFILEGVNNG